MATAQNQDKILRIGVIQGGKIIEERIIKKRETVTIGHGSKNTIIVPASSLPASFPVFEMRGSTYLLRFTDSMSGRLSHGDAQLDFGTLKAQKLAKPDREGFAVPLNDSSKGKISLGEVTLLFQFIAPPVDVPKAVVTDIAKGSLWGTIDRFFFSILLVCLLFDFGFVKAVTMRAAKPDVELTLEDLPDRFARIVVPEIRTPPKKKEEVAKVEEKKPDENKTEKKGTKKPVATAPIDAKARREAIAKNVAGKGLLKLLGATGSNNGSIENVLSGGAGNTEIASALRGASGVTENRLASGGRRGDATGAQAGIGNLGTSGGASGSETALGDKKNAQVSGRVIDQSPDVESSSCDREAIARYVKRNLKAIQSCYEHQLKRNVGLKGKVVIRFTIGPSGRVQGIPEIEEDSLGDRGVATCIQGIIRMWTFPIKDNECPVAYPFVFAPAS